MPKLFNQALLFGFVEIDHDIAAEDNVVAARQEFRFQIVKVELHEFLQLRLDLVLVSGFFEIAEPAGVIDRFHLLLGIKTFLADAQAGIADVRGDDFHFPWRGNERLRRRHFERERIPQVVISERIADQNGEDRKSTRLNSSHGYISYAVFCLKKKKRIPSLLPSYQH